MPTYHYVQLVMGQLNYFDSFPLHCYFFQAFDSDVYTNIHDSLYPASVKTEKVLPMVNYVKLETHR